MEQWLVLLHHSKKVLSLIPLSSQDLSVWSLRVPPCLCGLPPMQLVGVG